MVAAFAPVEFRMTVIVGPDLLFGDDDLGLDFVVDQACPQNLLLDLVAIGLHGHRLAFQKAAQILIGELVGRLDALNGAVDFGVLDADAVARDLLVGELFVHQSVEHILAHLVAQLVFLCFVVSLLLDALDKGGHACIEFGQQNDVFVDHGHDTVDHLGGGRGGAREAAKQYSHCGNAAQTVFSVHGSVSFGAAPSAGTGGCDFSHSAQLMVTP